jgi:hypothetical protein
MALPVHFLARNVGPEVFTDVKIRGIFTLFSPDNLFTACIFVNRIRNPRSVPGCVTRVGTVSFQTSRLEKPMDTHFDIFQVEENSTPQKIAFAQSLDEARKQVQELMVSNPAKYVVISSRSGIVVSTTQRERTTQ